MNYAINRRAFLAQSSLLAMTTNANATRQSHATDVGVVGLKTDYLAEPLGLESARPQFSWQLLSERRGVHQSAYRIAAASSSEALEHGHSDVWDSGRIASSDCFAINYGGPPLHSRQRVFWRVTVWDEQGIETAASEIASFEM